MAFRPRERILANLEAIYREAYERAKAASDQARMADLDAAYAPKADLGITAGLVGAGLTSGAPQPGAVAVAQGKVIAVGDSAELARYVGSKTRLVQANGGLVMPGFADGHTHFISGGFQLA